MKVGFLGDLALVGQFSSNDNLDDRVAYLKKIVSDCDFLIGNLESPLTNKRFTLVPKSMHIKADETCVDVLKKLGVAAVSLANNHTYDYGRKGLIDTIKTLDSAGIKWYGADDKSVVVEILGETISISGFCCLSTNGAGYQYGNSKGINALTRSQIENQVLNDKEAGAVSIISVHFGIEHTNYPALEHISLFNEVAKKNQVIIHGHHPHQIQGITRVNESIIAYSLGNALFDKTTSINGSFTVRMNEENRKSYVLIVEIRDGKIVGFETRGFFISDDGIKPYDVEEELTNISNAIYGIEDENKYQALRKNQYQKVLDEKFGKHDLKWVVSRLNYYSIGAKVSSIIRAKTYKKVKDGFYRRDSL